MSPQCLLSGFGSVLGLPRECRDPDEGKTISLNARLQNHLSHQNFRHCRLVLQGGSIYIYIYRFYTVQIFGDSLIAQNNPE